MYIELSATVNNELDMCEVFVKIVEWFKFNNIKTHDIIRHEHLLRMQQEIRLPSKGNKSFEHLGYQIGMNKDNNIVIELLRG